MAKSTKYVSKIADPNGYVQYTDEENKIWETLITRQRPLVENRACEEYLNGLDILAFNKNTIPQLPDVNKKLYQATGWSVEPVDALIGFQEFFDLLAARKFPAATFIRNMDELDYLQEPDIFHELFGHTPMLTNPVYADFMHKYGEFGQSVDPKYHAMLMRMYWFTVEFGLIKLNNELKIYGGGILSSIGETPYSLESEIPIRKPLDPLTVFRTPYRIDILQTVYFVIDGFQDLYNLDNLNLRKIIDQAKEMGMFPSTFAQKQ